MSKRNKEHIKRLIGEAGVEKAPLDFTKQVMQDIFVSASEEGLKDEKLATLLKEPGLEIPSNKFVSNIMKDVEVQRNLEYQPLISKKGWLVISAFFIGILVFVLFKDMPEQPSAIFAKLIPYLEASKNTFSNPFEGQKLLNLTKLSPILAISLFCLSSMLLFDTKLKRRLFT